MAKNPAVNAAPPDPSLWIVHYHQAEPNRILPTQSVPLSPQMRQIMSERRWLESQGRLEKKDFMLHDRSQWPSIHVPSAAHHQQQQQQPGNFYNPNNPMGPPLNQPPQGWPQQPPQKRQRQHPPSSSGLPGSSEGAHDTSIEDEENTAAGDFFDHLTPRDISMARYQQHHRWMEEVFSSPYASNQIVPPDLGLGLMGELKGLTEGLLEQPSMDFSSSEHAAVLPSAAKAKGGAHAFTNLKTEQIDEFNKRIEKHMAEGQAEIEVMKAEHAAKMAGWKKSSRTLMQAEKRLRGATWEGHESALPTNLRLEGTEEVGEGETVEAVVSEVEGLLGGRVGESKEAVLVEKGGLEREEVVVPLVREEAVAEQSSAMEGSGVMLEEPVVYHQDPAPAGGLPMQQQMAGLDGNSQQAQMPSLQQQQQVQETMHQHQRQQQQVIADLDPEDADDQSQTLHDEATGEMGEMDMSMNDTSMLEGMDLDVEDEGDDINFDESGLDTAQEAGEGDARTGTFEAGEGLLPRVGSTAAEAEAAGLGVDDSQSVGAGGLGEGSLAAISPSAAMASAMQDVGAGEAQAGMADGGLFNEVAFDDFTNVGGNVEAEGEEVGADDLLDFGQGEVGVEPQPEMGEGEGMDESAFGDALHGMEAEPEPGQAAL